MSDMKFSKDHEYVRMEGDLAVVGITNFAQEQLGDIVFVELPETGRTLAKGDEAAVVDSVKAAAEVYAPVGGEVVEVNGELNKNPALVNEDAEGGAWFFKLKVANKDELAELMDADAYTAFAEGAA
jgi:glycine cleavage system H protein